MLLAKSLHLFGRLWPAYAPIIYFLMADVHQYYIIRAFFYSRCLNVFEAIPPLRHWFITNLNEKSKKYQCTSFKESTLRPLLKRIKTPFISWWRLEICLQWSKCFHPYWEFFYFPPQAENAALAGRITLIGESSRLERAARCALM